MNYAYPRYIKLAHHWSFDFKYLLSGTFESMLLQSVSASTYINYSWLDNVPIPRFLNYKWNWIDNTILAVYESVREQHYTQKRNWYYRTKDVWWQKYILREIKLIQCRIFWSVVYDMMWEKSMIGSPWYYRIFIEDTEGCRLSQLSTLSRWLIILVGNLSP